MKLATIITAGIETSAIYTHSGWVTLSALNQHCGCDWSTDVLKLLESGQLEMLKQWYRQDGEERIHWHREALGIVPDVTFAPLYRRPRKIWGIGLNYRDHATDLSETVPENEPGSFMKPDTTIIGHGDTIEIPRQSERTTAEAELGIIFDRSCKNVPRANWLDAVAGFTTVIDMTAEDILRRNPRYLTLCKSFDTFFSFGPVLLTRDEIEDVSRLEVCTVVNGQVCARNLVANMTFPPNFLVEFHTSIMTQLPGDIISTGTPGAAVIADGDVVECRIDGFTTLVNRVLDLKA